MNFYAPYSCLVLVLKFTLWIFPEISLDSASPRRAGNIHYRKKLLLSQESSRFHSSLYRDEMGLPTSAYV